MDEVWLGNNCWLIKRQLKLSLCNDIPEFLPDKLLSHIYWWRQGGGLLDIYPSMSLLNRICNTPMGPCPRILNFILKRFTFETEEILNAVENTHQGSEIEDILFNHIICY